MKTMKIEVFVSHIATDHLQKLFEWFWMNKIINIFVAGLGAILSDFHF